MDGMASIECDPACGFMVRSHDEQEVLDVARTHAKKAHDKEASEGELRQMMKTA